MQFQAILLYQNVKDGAVIKISNIGLYMDRTIHCGNYDLNFVAGNNMPNNTKLWR